MNKLYADLVKATEKAFDKYYNGKIELCCVSDEIDAILQKKYTKGGQVLYLHCIWPEDDDYAEQLEAIIENTMRWKVVDYAVYQNDTDNNVIVLAEILKR